MVKTLEAVFDGTVLRPIEPLSLQPNTRVRITIETESEQQPVSFLQTARSLDLEGPPDWSERVDEYLYGKSGQRDE
jgi:predicted DNA-binding antitoxin AbrB/MazE fold protein